MDNRTLGVAFVACMVCTLILTCNFAYAESEIEIDDMEEGSLGSPAKVEEVIEEVVEFESAGDISI